MAEAGSKKEEKGGEGEAPAKEGAAVAAKSSKKLPLLIMGGVVGLLILIGVPVAVLTLKGKEKEPSAEQLAADAALAQEQVVAEGTNDEDELAEGEEPPGAFFPFEGFVLNLQGGGFIRVQMNVEFTSRDIPNRFYAKLIPLRDMLIALITTKKAETLLTENGKEDLRIEIKEKINEMMRKEDIKKVYFTQFVIQ